MVDWLFAELPLPAAAAEPAEDVLPAVLALLEAPTAWLLLDNGLEAASAGGVFAAAGALAVLASAEGFLAGVGALIVPAAPVLAVFVALLADVDAALPPCAAALGACVSCEVDLTDFPAPLLPPAWLLAAAALLLFNTLGAALVSACCCCLWRCFQAQLLLQLHSCCSNGPARAAACCCCCAECAVCPQHSSRGHHRLVINEVAPENMAILKDIHPDSMLLAPLPLPLVALPTAVVQRAFTVSLSLLEPANIPGLATGSHKARRTFLKFLMLPTDGMSYSASRWRWGA
jgi:hypothetical protein